MYYGKLQFLPCGSITAEGWLGEELRRSADGLGGHMDQLEPKMILDPYLKKSSTNAWGGSAAGWGAEIAGNYWYGLIALAFTLPDAALQKKAEAWVNGVLANQEEDGYLGAYSKTDNRAEDYNAWGNACGMRALLLYAEATGRGDVFDAVYRGLLWFCRTDAWTFTPYAGPTIVRLLAYCYLRTGDRELLDFAHRYEAYLDEPLNDIFRIGTDAFGDAHLYYNQNHAAAYAFQCSRPAALYLADGEARRLDASVQGIEKLRDKCLLPNGGIAGNAEWLSPKSPIAETEYCTDTFMASSYAILAAATGDRCYGDYMEEIVFNAAQGARKKDERAITYFTAPNQLCATDHSSHVHDPHGMYAPVHSTSCCSVNSVVILPEFVKNIAMTDQDGNLWLQSYAPCRIRHQNAELQLSTQYPFRQDVTLKITCPDGAEADFSLFLRVPAWCEDMTVDAPGKKLSPKNDQGFLELSGPFRDGDSIRVHLSMTPRVRELDDTDGADKHPLWVSYGPLCFALPVPEIWNCKGNGYAQTPLPEGWNWYEVKYPRKTLEGVGAQHRLDPHSWNFATTRERLEESMTVQEVDTDGYVWEDPPLKITAAGWQAPWVYNHYVPRTNELYGKTTPVTFPREVSLVPFGCTALRITCFSKAALPALE